VSKEERVEPTPETVERLEGDPLWEMTQWRNGYAPLLDTAGEAAATEILAVYRAVVKSTMRLGQNSYGPEFGGPRGGVSEMPDDMAWAYSNRYVPWANSLPHGLLEWIINLLDERKMMSDGMKRVCAKAIMKYARLM
jgi:hypothetical protein